MHWKTMFDRCYCIVSTKCSETFAKKVALYFVNVWYYIHVIFVSTFPQNLTSCILNVVDRQLT